MLYGLLAVVLMAMDQRGHYIPRIRGAAELLAEPVYHVVEWPARAIRNLYGQFQSRRTLRHENENLREQLLGQQGDLQRLETLVEENRRLRALIEGANSQSFEFQFAELVQVDLDPFSHKIMVDRGSRDGVVIGQAVIDGAGVMGQVEDVHPHFSSIRLISDPNHALPVQINRTGLRTIAFGSGETGILNLPNVPRQADIREGDLVVTSGLGDRFPGGYPVAIISRVDRRDGQTFIEAQATPLAALDRGREVLLIANPEPLTNEDEVSSQTVSTDSQAEHNQLPPAEDAGDESLNEPADESVSEPGDESADEPANQEEPAEQAGGET